MPDNGNLEVGSEQHFFRIGQVCRLTDIKSFTLRYWESEFPSLQPVKSSKGQRLYRREDVETVLRIKRLLYDEGFTIAGARRYLRDLDDGAAQPATPPEAGGEFEAQAGAAALRRESSTPHPDPAIAWPEPDLAAAGPEPASPEEDEADSQFIGSSGGASAGGGSSSEHRDLAVTQPVVAPPVPSTAAAGKDAAGMLSRKLLLDLRDALRAFLTLLENE